MQIVKLTTRSLNSNDKYEVLFFFSEILWLFKIKLIWYVWHVRNGIIFRIETVHIIELMDHIKSFYLGCGFLHIFYRLKFLFSYWCTVY